MLIAADKCDFMTTLELSSCVEKERRNVTLIDKSAVSLRSAVNFNFIILRLL